MAVTKKNAARVLFGEDGSREKRNSGTDYVWDPSQQSAGEVVGAHWADPETPGLWYPPQWHQPVQGSEELTQSNRQDSTDKTKEINLLEKILGGPDPYGAKKSGFGKPQVPESVSDQPAADLLEKLIGGPDPYGAKPAGFVKPQVPETEGGSTVPEKESEEQIGTGVTDVEVNGYIETLRGILDPDYAARASEDVMGQYAAMTGGRPSSAAISAGTAARADAEATLLRELLSGGDTQSGENGGLLSGLLEEDTSEGDAYADWVAPLLEGKDGLFNEQEVELLVSYMPTLVKELEAEYPSDYAYRIYYLIQSMFDNGNITESTYNSLLGQTGLDGFIG